MTFDSFKKVDKRELKRESDVKEKQRVWDNGKNVLNGCGILIVSVNVFPFDNKLKIVQKNN